MHERAGLDAVEKRKFLGTRWESNPGHPACTSYLYQFVKNLILGRFEGFYLDFSLNPPRLPSIGKQPVVRPI
jgi:hypothetical protein